MFPAKKFVPESQRLPKYGVIFGTSMLSLEHACYIYIVCIHVDVPVYPLMKALGVIPLIAENK